MSAEHMSRTRGGVEYVTAHLNSPRDGCQHPCCRVTFTDHKGVLHVWVWAHGQWETTDGRTYGR